MESLLDKFTLKLNMSAFPTVEKYTGTIFHYTSTNNINPILLNGNDVVLWASRYDCLNDISEGTIPQIRFLEVCEKEVFPYLNEYEKERTKDENKKKR